MDQKVPAWSLKNQQAEAAISSYARRHAWADVGVGAIGTVVPTAALPGLGLCILAQYPLIYRPLSRKLSSIYSEPSGSDKDKAGPKDWGIAASLAGAKEVDPRNIPGLQQLSSLEFFLELGKEYANEVGFGFALSMLPFIGGILGAHYDAKAAITMTWRVGTMISLFFQNGSNWIVDRKRTFDIAKEVVGPVSLKNSGRVNLNNLVQGHDLGKLVYSMSAKAT